MTKQEAQAFVRVRTEAAGEIDLAYYEADGRAAEKSERLPLVMLQETVLTAEAGFQPLFMVAWFIIIWSALLAGELLERSLYFRCAVSSRMPGGG